MYSDVYLPMYIPNDEMTEGTESGVTTKSYGHSGGRFSTHLQARLCNSHHWPTLGRLGEGGNLQGTDNSSKAYMHLRKELSCTHGFVLPIQP